MGSMLASLAGEAPQQELPPLVTRRAALPYFSFTTSLIVGSLTGFLTYRFELCCEVRRLYCVCSIRRTEIAEPAEELRCWPSNAGRCFHGVRGQDLRFSICPDDEKEWNWECPIPIAIRRRPGRRGERRGAVA